jgi:iron complex outermembrane receptor protein
MTINELVLGAVTAVSNCLCVGSVASAESPELDAIVVTAEKRAEPVQKVPAAVQVVSGPQLEAAGVKDLTGLEFNFTGATFDFALLAIEETIRGIGPAAFQPGIDSPVSFNIDGLDAPRVATLVGLFDLDRVEVLPGPQGTLYGGAASGGVVNFVTRNPGKDFAIETLAEVGNYNATHVSFAVDGPITSKLRMRAVYDRDTHDGYLSNGEDDKVAQAGRLTLVGDPTDDLTFNLKATYFHNGGNGAGQSPASLVDTPDPWAYNTPPLQSFSLPPREDLTIFMLNLRTDWGLGDGRLGGLELGELTLSYEGGYVGVNHHLGELAGPAANPQDLYGHLGDHRQTHEIRLLNSAGPLKFLVGLWYERDTTTWYTKFIDLAGAGSGVDFQIFQMPRPQLTESEAAYTQVTYSLADALRVTGGARYSIDKKQVENAAYLGVPLAFEHTWHRPDWKAGVEYDLSRHNMLYATIQSGYTRGGYDPNTAGEISPATAIAYSMGAKNTFSNGRIVLNDEGFYYDYRNYQVIAAAVSMNPVPIFNVPKSAIYGDELDANVQLTEDDVFSGGVTWLHARYTNFPAGSVDLTGLQMKNAPDWTANVGWQHTFRLGSAGKLVADFQNHYNAGYWSEFDHGLVSNIGSQPGCDGSPAGAPACEDGIHQKPFWKSDTNLTYSPQAGNWHVTFFVLNMQNVVTKGGGLNLNGVRNASFDPPRLYGFRVQGRF